MHPPLWRNYFSDWHRYHAIRRWLGIPISRHAGALRGMLHDLKTASEQVLGRPIRKVSIAQSREPEVCWITTSQFPPHSDFYDAMVLAGLEPLSDEGAKTGWGTCETWIASMPGAPGRCSAEAQFIGELSATLGASGRWLCQPYGCGKVPQNEQRPAKGVFLVRSVVYPSPFISWEGANRLKSTTTT